MKSAAAERVIERCSTLKCGSFLERLNAPPQFLKKGKMNAQSDEKKKSSIKRELLIKRGDFLFSDEALPYIDAIVDDLEWKTGKKDITFSKSILEDYLKFLELIVLYPRVIVGFAKIRSTKEYRAKLRRKGHLDIENNLYKTLLNKKILYNAEVISPDNSPEKIVRDFLPKSPKLKSIFQKNLDNNKLDFDFETKKDDEIIILAESFGKAMYFSEFARTAQIPYYLSDEELDSLKWLDETENHIKHGLINFFKERLDKGSEKILRHLNQIGVPHIFPETPIASIILNESKKPDDLLLIALQLRDEFKSFRKEIIFLEEKLYNENIPIKKKQKIMKRVHSLAQEIWPEQKYSFFKETFEQSGLLYSAVSDTMTNLSLNNISNLVMEISNKPLEIVLKSIRLKKIRILLKAKKRFLNTTGCSIKLSQIFNLPRKIIDSGE